MFLIRLALLLTCAALVACSSAEGPLIYNASGRAIQLVVRSEDGSVFEGACDNEEALWVGKARTATVRVEIVSGGERHVLAQEELNTRFGKDETTAFIVEASGPRKLTLVEARILLRGRAR